jgi:predicted lipid-binding transport protein (Tim44 family)
MENLLLLILCMLLLPLWLGRVIVYLIWGLFWCLLFLLVMGPDRFLSFLLTMAIGIPLIILAFLFIPSSRRNQDRPTPSQDGNKGRRP